VALDGLAASRFSKVAIANPRTAPLGRYTRQALEAAGLWDGLASRLVSAENARQTLDYVARGEVDAGIVYASDTRLLAGRVTAGPAVSSELHEPIVYEGVVLADTRRAGQAAALLEWLASEPGRRSFVRHGFLLP
jgi:molybdate transport system substrate-binding protein